MFCPSIRLDQIIAPSDASSILENCSEETELTTSTTLDNVTEVHPPPSSSTIIGDVIPGPRRSCRRSKAVLAFDPSPVPSLIKKEKKKQQRQPEKKNVERKKCPKTRERPKEARCTRSVRNRSPQLVSNPKTVRDRKNNSDILHALNASHDDDFFLCKDKLQLSGLPSPSSSVRVQNRSTLDASDILEDLFASDESDGDISVNQSRSSIHDYLSDCNRSKLRQSPVVQNLTCGETDNMEKSFSTGFQGHAYIHKKILESRSRSKLLGSKPKPAPSPNSKASANRSLILDVRVAYLMNEMSRTSCEDADDADGFAEPYFSSSDDAVSAAAPEDLLREYQGGKDVLKET